MAPHGGQAPDSPKDTGDSPTTTGDPTTPRVNEEAALQPQKEAEPEGPLIGAQ